MKRRQALAFLGSAASLPRITHAQQAKKIPVIGFLHPGLKGLGSVTMDSLRRDMGAAGLIDGQTVRVEERWAASDQVRLLAFAKELVSFDPVLIIAIARPSIEAIRRVSTTVPIVGNDLKNDPVSIGYAASIAKPGGNVTGMFLDAPTASKSCSPRGADFYRRRAMTRFQDGRHCPLGKRRHLVCRK